MRFFDILQWLVIGAILVAVFTNVNTQVVPATKGFFNGFNGGLGIIASGGTAIPAYQS